jgi:hypothetical protein
LEKDFGSMTPRLLHVFCALCLLCLITGALAQNPPRSLAQAALATELPVGPWGPYARGHSGICFLVDRAQGQQFAFPLVVGQRREEVTLRTVPDADGKRRLRPTKVTLERRSLGLAPLLAADNDARPLISPLLKTNPGGEENIVRRG